MVFLLRKAQTNKISSFSLSSATNLCIASLYYLARNQPINWFPLGDQQSVWWTKSGNLGAYQACGQGRPDSGWSKNKAAQWLPLPSQIFLFQRKTQ